MQWANVVFRTLLAGCIVYLAIRSEVGIAFTILCALCALLMLFFSWRSFYRFHKSRQS